MKAAPIEILELWWSMNGLLFLFLNHVDTFFPLILNPLGILLVPIHKVKEIP